MVKKKLFYGVNIIIILVERFGSAEDSSRNLKALSMILSHIGHQY